MTCNRKWLAMAKDVGQMAYAIVYSQEIQIDLSHVVLAKANGLRHQAKDGVRQNVQQCVIT